jgi:hypothetical protein
MEVDSEGFGCATGPGDGSFVPEQPVSVVGTDDVAVRS